MIEEWPRVYFHPRRGVLGHKKALLGRACFEVPEKSGGFLFAFWFFLFSSLFGGFRGFCGWLGSRCGSWGCCRCRRWGCRRRRGNHGCRRCSCLRHRGQGQGAQDTCNDEFVHGTSFNKTKQDEDTTNHKGFRMTSVNIEGMNLILARFLVRKIMLQSFLHCAKGQVVPRNFRL
jgi:hypothetical protein